MHVQPLLPALEDPAAGSSTRVFSAAEAIALVVTWTDLTPPRRRDLASHLATAARMAGLPPGVLMLTPAMVRERVRDRSAAGHGVAITTMRNVLSGLRIVMRRLGAVDAIDRSLDPAWAAQVALLPVRKQPGLVAFARHCSARGVAPAAVTVADLNAFEARLVERSIAGDPSKIAGAVRGDWNRAAQRIPGWVGEPMGQRKPRSDYVLPLSAFTEEFQASLAAFGRRLCATALDGFDDDPVDDADGDPRPLPSGRPVRASTAQLRMDHARWAASAAVAAGVPLGEITSVAALVTPVERAKAAIRFVYDRAGQKPSPAGMHVAEVLRIIAKYDARLPPGEVAKLTRWGGPVRVAYRGMTDRNERELAAAIEPAALQRLLALPEALMAAARRLRAEGAPEQARTLALRAVAVGILLHLPIRLANLRGLRLGLHLWRPDPRRGLVTHLVVPAEETKNDRDVRLPVTPALARLIDEWVTQHRWAPTPDRGWLFPHQCDPERPMSPQGLRDAIEVATRNVSGAELSPHQFRHLAAKLFLAEFPGHFEEVRQLLGHASVATTIRHYAGEQVTETARRYHQEVLGASRGGGGDGSDGRDGKRKPATTKRGRRR